MSNYNISSNFDKSKVYILKKSELEKRLDPFYYLPELVELEKRILLKNPKKLNYYVKYISSGATPKRDEGEKYYSNHQNGIPFLRVQNLSPTGVLQFSDCKYINTDTHNGLLKRSQVSAGDLLIKITGVGRMAVSSIAPNDFCGNINQHICVIKTGNKGISEKLAAFLNSNIGEKLASRRSTGGTRPALDYPALLSIPIIDDERILQINNNFVEKKRINDAEIAKRISKIDDFLLYELKIKLPESIENSLMNRVYFIQNKNISGGRFDPFYHQSYFQDILTSIQKSPFNKLPLKKLILSMSKGIEVGSNEYCSDGISFVRVSDISDFSINADNTDKKVSFEKYEELKTNFNPKVGELLYSKDGTIGICTVVKDTQNYLISSGILRIRTQNHFHNYFLKYVLSSKLYKQIADRISIGTIIKHLTIEEWLKIPIPVPPFDKQKEIANHINTLMREVQNLKNKTNEEIAKANKKIEKILIGGN